MKSRSRNPKEYKRRRRHMSLRRRLSGTPERPRVCVFRSNTNIYAQVIDDTSGRTIASVSSLKVKPGSAPAASAEEGEKKGKKDKKQAPMSAGMLMAREVGRLLAEAAKEKGITKIAFDRGGYLYHGRIKALADAAREHGLEF